MVDNKTYYEFYKKLGEAIKIARKRVGFSQDIVANHLQLTRISIVNIEHGKQKIQLHTLLALCELLNLDVGEFLLPLTTNKNVNQKIEKDINKELEQLDHKEDATKIIKSFMTISKLKKVNYIAYDFK